MVSVSHSWWTALPVKLLVFSQSIATATGPTTACIEAVIGVSRLYFFSWPGLKVFPTEIWRS